MNRTETKVAVIFDLQSSLAFSKNEKEQIGENLKSRLKAGCLRVNYQNNCSQHRNKEVGSDSTIVKILDNAHSVPERRKPTKISTRKKASLKSKKLKSEMKLMRIKSFHLIP